MTCNDPSGEEGVATLRGLGFAVGVACRGMADGPLASIEKLIYISAKVSNRQSFFHGIGLGSTDVRVRGAMGR